MMYVEWCAERRPCRDDKCTHRPGQVEGCALDDVELWRQANPAIDRRISVGFIKTERRTLPPDEFMRERLCWWEEPEESVDGLPVEVWAECLDAESQVDPVAFGVFPAVDLSWTAVAAVGQRVDGLTHIEVVEYLPGTEWVAARCADLVATYGVPVAVMPSGPRSSIGEDLAKAGVVPLEAKAADLMAGCGALLDRVLRRTIRHIGQPELDLSVAKGRRRLVGDAWTWALRASGVDISPIVAGTLALWAATQPVEDDTSVYEDRDLVVL